MQLLLFWLNLKILGTTAEKDAAKPIIQKGDKSYNKLQVWPLVEVSGILRDKTMDENQYLGIRNYATFIILANFKDFGDHCRKGCR